MKFTVLDFIMFVLLFLPNSYAQISYPNLDKFECTSQAEFSEGNIVTKRDNKKLLTNMHNGMMDFEHTFGSIKLHTSVQLDVMRVSSQTHEETYASARYYLLRTPGSMDSILEGHFQVIDNHLPSAFGILLQEYFIEQGIKVNLRLVCKKL